MRDEREEFLFRGQLCVVVGERLESMSEVVRQMARRPGLPPTRKSLTELAVLRPDGQVIRQIVEDAGTFRAEARRTGKWRVRTPRGYPFRATPGAA